MSGDPVLRQEIIDKANIHENNRQRFNLPERVIAKIFVFRLIYGGGAYSYAHDPAFMHVSTSEKYWQAVIDEFYDKYKGIKEWHARLIDTAIRTGQLEIPSGRIFPIKPDYNKRNPWPETIIKNYPVQGFGADLVMLARLQAARYLNQSGLRSLLISTIHDSIVADCPSNEVEQVGKMLNQAVEDVPQLCKQVFGYAFKLPMTAEVQYGPNKKEMQELTFA